jgi:hypothetical protein
MAQANLDGLPDFLKPKLRLFMSVDITGSTQFKQILSHKSNPAHKDDTEEGVPSEPWLSPILEFYGQISALFEDQWHQIARHASDDQHEWDVGDRPTVWKAVGDELIFTKVLTDHRQAYVCVTAWLLTIQAYRTRIKEHSAGLDLKCAAWIAGFPINNAEVILDHESSGVVTPSDDGDYIFGNLSRLEQAAKPTGNVAGIRDFIGPSIDTGFRVSSVASPRRFVLSVDLAFVLAHTHVNLPMTWEFPQLEFYYEGRKDLKGVTNGTPYPIFWVNAAKPDALMVIEDKIEKRSPTAASLVKEFCEHFLEKNKDTHVMRPFILGDADSLFKRVPARHGEKLTKLAKYWQRESERRESEEKAQLETDEQTDSNNASVNIEELGSQLTSDVSVEKPAPTNNGEPN